MFSLVGRCHGLALSQKEHRHPQRPGDLAVQRHLLALIPGQRATQMRGEPGEGHDEGVADRVGGVVTAG